MKQDIFCRADRLYMVVSKKASGRESMNANGQDVIEAKLKTEDPALVAGMVATRVESIAGQVTAKVAGRVESGDPLGHDVWIYRMVVGLLGLV